MLEQTINDIESYAIKLGLSIHKGPEGRIDIFSSPFTGLVLHIEGSDDNPCLQFAFSCRTNSYLYNGERTDLHDTISIIFAIYLKKMRICSSLCIDVNLDFTIDGEVYGRYLFPSQIGKDIHCFQREDVLNLMNTFMLFENFFWNSFGGCPCDECRKRLKYEYDFRWEDIELDKIKKIQNVIGENDCYYCERTLPTWFYYRDFKEKITIIDSIELMKLVSSLIYTDTNGCIDGISGVLFIKDEFNNFISNKDRKRLFNYLKKMEGVSFNPQLVPIENKLIGIGKKYILIQECQCGINEFKIEKSRLYERHIKEYETLFKPASVIWSDEIDGVLFESMIKELLEQEPYVKRVRAMAHANERDGGMDLSVDWMVPNIDIKKIEEKKHNLIKVVVQCKALKRGVGKSDVRDIRDTVEYLNYNGFFIATSSYIRKSLSDHLDKLRLEGRIWIDWWGRDEINTRLLANRDILKKYSMIVKALNIEL